MWTTEPSWTFDRAPIVIGSMSARSTHVYQTLDSSPIVTAPVSTAPGATHARSCTVGPTPLISIIT